MTPIRASSRRDTGWTTPCSCSTDAARAHPRAAKAFYEAAVSRQVSRWSPPSHWSSSARPRTRQGAARGSSPVGGTIVVSHPSAAQPSIRGLRVAVSRLPQEAQRGPRRCHLRDEPRSWAPGLPRTRRGTIDPAGEALRRRGPPRIKRAVRAPQRPQDRRQPPGERDDRDGPPAPRRQRLGPPLQRPRGRAPTPPHPPGGLH